MATLRIKVQVPLLHLVKQKDFVHIHSTDMHHHSKGEELVQEHPLLCNVVKHLQSPKALPRPIARILTRDIYFAYPRTLWLKLSLEADDIPIIQSAKLETIGRAFKTCLKENKFIKHLVLDVLEIKVVDAKLISHLCKSVFSKLNGLASLHIICGEQVRPFVFPPTAFRGVNFSANRGDALLKLRSVESQATAHVKLPKQLDMAALDKFLLARHNELDKSDAIYLNLDNVEEGTFEVYSMISPIIHSLAHERGILASACASTLAEKDLVKYGALFPMRSFIIQTPQVLLQNPDASNTHSVIPLTCFVSDDPIQTFCEENLRLLLQNALPWFRQIAGITQDSPPSPREFQQLTSLFKNLLHILKELLDNISMHAIGVGYVMMELNPHIGKGLSIYIGDTGVGLRAGVSNRYHMNLRSDAKVLQNVFHLVEHMDKRRKLPGHIAFGGRGLDRVRTTLIPLAGKLTIRTGSALAAYEPVSADPLKVESGKFPIQGTHFHITIPTRSDDILKA